MKPYSVVVSAITAFCIVGGGALGAVLVALEGNPLKEKAIIICVITGLVAAMKDIRATLSLPPLSNGNYDAIAQLVKSQPKPKEETKQ